jgi:16S rRNA (cytosine967-C5)-methyltransferase
VHHEQQLAARAVQRVLEGATLPAALAAVDDQSATRGHALVQELAYGTLRHWGRLDALTRVLATKPISDSLLATLVAVALYQIDHTHAPAFAVVDRAVEAASLLARPQAKGLVNALLRRYLREREALNAQVVSASPVARWSYPRWWIGRVEADYPHAWQDILAAGNERPPLTLRVNRRRTSRERVLTDFAAAGVEATAVGSAGIVVTPRPVGELPGWNDGDFSVQDAGAQLAAPLLDVRDGMRVLDACAAPGGKATHLAELADVELMALDSDAARLVRVDQNFARLQLSGARIRTVTGDAGDPTGWWDGRPFDRVLADVPCTASGIIRRHPDGKWLRRKTDIAGFQAQQRRLLAALWEVVAPGGLFLYATCSVFTDENERQIEAFVATHSDALRESIILPAGCVHVAGQLLPSGRGASHNQDGFFYALLRKS